MYWRKLSLKLMLVSNSSNRILKKIKIFSYCLFYCKKRPYFPPHISPQGLLFLSKGGGSIGRNLPASTFSICYSGKSPVSIVPPLAGVMVLVRCKHCLSLSPGGKQTVPRLRFGRTCWDNWAYQKSCIWVSDLLLPSYSLSTSHIA